MFLHPYVPTRVIKLLLCAYYYYIIYLNDLLLLLETYVEPVTITITIARNIKKTYYHYYYFPDYYYYFPVTITLIITIELKKHNTSRLQSNIQRPILLPWYRTLPQLHYHR